MTGGISKGAYATTPLTTNNLNIIVPVRRKAWGVEEDTLAAREQEGFGAKRGTDRKRLGATDFCMS